MTASDLDHLEALAEKATPGPWVADGREIFLGGTTWADCVGTIYDEGGHTSDDAAFIAACDPDTIRQLVAIARASSS